jgi:hypothetical protein
MLPASRLNRSSGGSPLAIEQRLSLHRQRLPGAHGIPESEFPGYSFYRERVNVGPDPCVCPFTAYRQEAIRA